MSKMVVSTSFGPSGNPSPNASLHRRALAISY
jgi:hypothetical protein